LREHKNVNLTLDQLWREYRQSHPDGYQYSQFCVLFREWCKKQNVCMRQTHKAGEKVFVDYCDGLFLTDPLTGGQTPTDLFVGVWGASSYTYAEPVLSQDLPSWVESHKRMFAYFGCVPSVVTGDNLKSGVTKACRYEPDLNATYADFAEHYGVALIPARPRKPRDKAKVEAGCLVAQRWILAVLRHRTFTSLAELKLAIQELLEKLNTRVMKKIKKSRREMFELWDQPNAKALPLTPYEYAEWSHATVNIDYHITVREHYYSVPYRYVHERVDVRLTTTTVEVFRRGERIAAHARSFVKHKHTTLKEHMPLAHQKYVEWTPERIKAWAKKTGPQTVLFVETLMNAKAHPEQAYRACLGVFRLSQSYPAARVEAAAARALRYNMCSYKSIQLILQRSLDQHPESSSTLPSSLPSHENIRGEDYYQ
jgi:transposase